MQITYRRGTSHFMARPRHGLRRARRPDRETQHDDPQQKGADADAFPDAYPRGREIRRDAGTIKTGQDAE